MKYWYITYIDECPVCGCLNKWKERVTDHPKPEDIQKRYMYNQVYDYCLE